MPEFATRRCPVCDAALWAPDFPAIGSKKCPRCGADLWVLAGAEGRWFAVRQPGQSAHAFLANLAATVLGASADEMEKVLRQADSLELVEIVMDLEDALRSGRR